LIGAWLGTGAGILVAWLAFQGYSNTLRYGVAGILQLQQFIDDHYAEEFTLADLAGQFGFSESSLKRRFRQAAGLPVNKYCQLVRMARMKYLLLQSNLTVDTICFDIGYADPRFARRLFVAQTGCSPREFRQRNRVDAEAGSASEFL
jgi:AraC-like DNA-binding protein